MRDVTLDAVKGLAIVLMVFGHAVWTGPVREFVYLFHMPVFFIAAGWLFRGAEDGPSLGRAVLRRAARIWWPYVFWATVLIVCHDLLLTVGVYAADGTADSVYVRQGMTVRWGGAEIFRRCLQVPILWGGATGLGAPYWFLSVLFVTAVAYLLLDFGCRRLKLPRLPVLTLLALAAILIGRYGEGKVLQVLEDRFLIRPACTAFALYHVGVLLRAADLRLERVGRLAGAAIGIVCCLALVGLMRFGRVELVANRYPNVAFLLTVSTLGWYFLSAVALWIGGVLPAVAFVGRQTMPILLLHLLAFKCFDAVAIVLRCDDVLLLARPYRTYEGPLWCLAYVVVGVGMPLALSAGWRELKRRFAIMGNRDE